MIHPQTLNLNVVSFALLSAFLPFLAIPQITAMCQPLEHSGRHERRGQWRHLQHQTRSTFNKPNRAIYTGGGGGGAAAAAAPRLVLVQWCWWSLPASPVSEDRTCSRRHHSTYGTAKTDQNAACCCCCCSRKRRTSIARAPAQAETQTA